MGVFGQQTIGTDDYGGDQNMMRAQRFQANGTGTVTSITIYVVSGSGHLNVAAYADVSGAPGSLLGSGTAQAVSGPAAITFPGFSFSITNGAYYWLVFNCDSYTLCFAIASGTTNQFAEVAQTFGSWPSTFGTPTYEAQVYTIYATYTGASGTSLDGQSLTVTKWAEDATVQASQWDSWSGTAYKRKVKVYGIVRTYTIDCIESGVAWAQSLANYFENTALSGIPVIFYSSQAVRPVNSVSVYVLDVSWTLENIAGQNIRKFTLTLQEAQ
jgi:hypothetical protein